MLFCPNCGSIVFDQFCDYCGMELVFINGHAYGKEHFFDVQELHGILDAYIHNNNGYEKENLGLHRKNLFKELQYNKYERDSFFQALQNEEYDLRNLRTDYLNILNNPNSMSYFSFFDFYFGSISSKIRIALNSIDKSLNLIKGFRTNYNNYVKEHPDYSKYENDVDNYITSLDELINRLNDIKRNTQDKIIKLKYKKTPIKDKPLKQVIEYVFDINEELNDYEKDVYFKLKDKKQMDIIKFFNEKYENIQSKIKTSLSTIDEIKLMLSSLSDLIDNKQNKYYFDNEKYIQDKLSINQANIMDLCKLNLQKDIINKIIEDRINGNYIDSFNKLGEYGLSLRQLDEIREKVIIKTPKQKIKKLPQNNSLHKPAKTQSININKASSDELIKIPGISKINADKIIEMRKNGQYINSYEDLEKTLQLQSFQTKEIRKHTFISSTESKKDTITPDLSNQKNTEKKENLGKIDINTANLEELKTIPSINLIKAKKIIDLRQNGEYINSFKDLETKLNLNYGQINQIKDVIIISKHEKKTIGVRVLDI